MTTNLVLASSSLARKSLLERLRLPFTICFPDIDEAALAHESPTHLVSRLAKEKAQRVANEFPNHLIIGCDQVVVLEGEIMGKPGTLENAKKQLLQASGKQICSYTGLCLLNSKTRNLQTAVEIYEVFFRHLTPAMVKRYLELDDSLNCAGAIKAESLGIALFEKMIGKDPSALTGLPLIQLVRMLEIEGLRVV